MKKTDYEGVRRRRDEVQKVPLPGVVVRYGVDGRPFYGDMQASHGIRPWWPLLAWAYRDRQGIIQWMTKCSSEACSNDLALIARRYTGHTKCAVCRVRWVDGYASAYIQRHPEITRVILRPGKTLAHYVACANAGCSKYFWHRLYIRRGRRQCLDCDNTVFCEGFPVRNKKLQDCVDRLTQPAIRKDKSIHFQMRCATVDCESTFEADSFLQKKTNFCNGCSQKKRRLRLFEVAYNQMRRRAIYLAKKRNSLLSQEHLNYEDFAMFCSLLKCFYCQKLLVRGEQYGTQGYSTPLLDRIDSKKGYVKNNVVPCCANCNRKKSDWLTGQEFLAIILRRQGHVRQAHAILRASHIPIRFIKIRCK